MTGSPVSTALGGGDCLFLLKGIGTLKTCSASYSLFTPPQTNMNVSVTEEESVAAVSAAAHQHEGDHRNEVQRGSATGGADVGLDRTEFMLSSSSV